MISRRIEYLLWTLATDNTQLAAYAGCSESNFSRLKSGSRRPAKDSVTIKKFVTAICAAAKDKGMTDKLKTLVVAPDCTDEELPDAVAEWIFDPRGINLPSTPWKATSKQFGEKLAAAMNVADLTNSKLSRLANVDPSYISRMKGGSRMPKNNPSLIYRICGLIAAKAFEKKRQEELTALTGQQAEDVTSMTSALFGWLYNKRGAGGSQAVGRFIDRIASMPGEAHEEEHFEIKIKPDYAKVYTGVAGLQSAVTRFLSTAAKAGNRTLLLYSDQPTGWLSGSFHTVWEELMRECLENKVRMKIIHNIEHRMLSEIFEAISSWLPLYMTGGIEPYYCTLNEGERLYSTIFIDEGHACIEATFVRGMEGTARYRYITAADELLYARQNFETVLLDCRPLIKIKQIDELSLIGKYRIFSSNGIQLYLGERDVIIQKLSTPKLSFCLEHPDLVRAIRLYIEERNMY